jgi:hypothetical protein
LTKDEEIAELRATVRKYHKWLERCENYRGDNGGYMGLDHKVGENPDGCDGCAILNG